VEAELKDEFDYSLLGYCVGEQIGYGVPVIVGIPKHPSTEEFINLCAMSNVSGAISMFHLPGFTVEAATVEEAFRDEVPKQKVVITETELKHAQNELQTTGAKADFVMLGCPNYTLKQIENVAKLLGGRKVHKDVSLWICTSATTKLLAERNGFVKIIEKAGGHVVVDTCIDEPCWVGYKGKVGMTDSPKCAYYRRFKEARVAIMKECIETAVKGG
jgi:predicted aconitase